MGPVLRMNGVGLLGALLTVSGRPFGFALWITRGGPRGMVGGSGTGLASGSVDGGTGPAGRFVTRATVTLWPVLLVPAVPA